MVSKSTSPRSRWGSRHRASPAGKNTAAPASAAPTAAPPQPLIRPSLVILEVASEEGIAGDAATVVDGYSSSSTGDEPVSSPETQGPSRLTPLKQPTPSLQQQQAALDKDEDAACDDLIFDILSGDGQPYNNDGFLSHLTDDMIVASSETIGGLSSSVKHEI